MIGVVVYFIGPMWPWTSVQQVIADVYVVGLGTLTSIDLCQHIRLGFTHPTFRKMSYPLKLNNVMNVTNWEFALRR